MSVNVADSHSYSNGNRNCNSYSTPSRSRHLNAESEMASAGRVGSSGIVVTPEAHGSHDNHGGHGSQGSTDDSSTSSSLTKPDINDVLCGRGGSINSHPGNENFRRLVEKRKRVYLTARFKREKRLIASSIVQEIRNMKPPGRFLSKKSENGVAVWSDIGDEKARDKTSQALRENAPTIRLEIETEINEQREEMKRHGDVSTMDHRYSPNQMPPPHAHHMAHPGSAPPPQPSAVPSQHHSYWDYNYYYNAYYGRVAPAPTPAPAPSPHARPHAHPHAPSPPPPYPQQHHPHHAWPQSHSHPHGQVAPQQQHHHGHHQPPSPVPHHYASHGHGQTPPSHPHGRMDARKRGAEESKTPDDDDLDFRYAAELQRQENMDVYSSSQRKNYARHKSGRPHHRHGNDANGPAFQPLSVDDMTATGTAATVDTSNNSSMSMRSNKPHRSQEEEDHRLAVALQEREDSLARNQMAASADRSHRTSRSNAFSQVNRTNRDAFARMMQNQAEQYGGVNVDKEMKQKRSQAVTTNDPTASLFTQIGNQLLGNFESWEPGMSVCPLDDVRGTNSPDLLQQQQEQPHGAPPSPSPSIANTASHSGSELLDAREVSPQQRPQGDWPSRVGSCHSWLPDTANIFGFNNTRQRNAALAPTPHFQSVGISPVNSLEMDVSANDKSQGSVGGGSLCQVFDPPVDKTLMQMMPQDDLMPRSLQHVPSWERSMRSLRSRSPVLGANASMDEEEKVHSYLLKPAAANKRVFARPPEGTILPQPRDDSNLLDPQEYDDFHHMPPPSSDAMEWE